jgi:hypothetical protein
MKLLGRENGHYEFVRAFIEGIVVQPDKLRLYLSNGSGGPI